MSISSATLYATSGALISATIEGPASVHFETTYIAGDVNGDGSVNTADESLIKFYMKPKSPEPPQKSCWQPT